MTLLRLVILGCVFVVTVQKSTPEDDSYVAAVVEYEVNIDTEANTYKYVSFIRQAAQQNADVIVFPESTLARAGESIPVPINGILKHNAPADFPELFHEVLVYISKAARENQIYVLINIHEELNCTEIVDEEEYCPENKTYLFNTNVVLDRDGYVIDRYRKIHLFGEDGLTPALKEELGMFTTDFGVTFGHFICFDLKFQVPSIQIIEKMNITDILYPTMWISELPYLTAVQIQEAYAYSLNINLIASGANNVKAGNAGSGIYSGTQGALVSTMPGLPQTELYVARVPKVPGTANWTFPGPQYSTIIDHDNLMLLSDSSIPSHVTKLLVPGYQEFTLVDNEVTCRFKIKFNQTDDKSYYYRAGAFDGIRTYSGFATGGTRICGVFSCTGPTKDTCGKRHSVYRPGVASTFDQLDITAKVPTPKMVPSVQARDSAYFPITLIPSIMPLEPHSDFTFNVTEDSNMSEYTLSLLDFDQELYSFAVWGRVYEKDGQNASEPYVEVEPSTDKSVTHYVNISMILALLFFVISN